MASTITLLNELAYSSIFIRSAPLTGVNGVSNQPGLFIGNWVRQFILSPPFAWRWNRAVTTIASTTAGTQDYAKTIADFGWLEKASLTDNTVSPAVTHELTIEMNLSEDLTQNQPIRISARLDDDAGSITFRLMPPPEKVYTVNLCYQKAAPIFAATSDTWAPIPDYFETLIQQGVLAKTYEYMNDVRFGAAMSLFVKQVVAANAGLSESQVNLFTQDWISTTREQQYQIQTSQTGTANRSLR